jgi:hypothetical protein
MKIRYYQNIDGWRWFGFTLAMLSVFILSSANISTQWIGWLLSCVSCSIWIYMGFKDKDIPRGLMECAYLLLSLRAVYNWISH